MVIISTLLPRRRSRLSTATPVATRPSPMFAWWDQDKGGRSCAGHAFSGCPWVAASVGLEGRHAPTFRAIQRVVHW